MPTHTKKNKKEMKFTYDSSLVSFGEKKKKRRVIDPDTRNCEIVVHFGMEYNGYTSSSES